MSSDRGVECDLVVAVDDVTVEVEEKEVGMVAVPAVSVVPMVVVVELLGARETLVEEMDSLDVLVKPLLVVEVPPEKAGSLAVDAEAEVNIAVVLNGAVLEVVVGPAVDPEDAVTKVVSTDTELVLCAVVFEIVSAGPPSQLGHSSISNTPSITHPRTV